MNRSLTFFPVVEEAVVHIVRPGIVDWVAPVGPVDVVLPEEDALVGVDGAALVGHVHLHGEAALVAGDRALPKMIN